VNIHIRIKSVTAETWIHTFTYS